MNDEFSFKVGDTWLTESGYEREIVYIGEKELVAKGHNVDLIVYYSDGKSKYAGYSDLVKRKPDIVKLERWVVLYKDCHGEISTFNNLYNKEEYISIVWKNNKDFIKAEKIFIEVEV